MGDLIGEARVAVDQSIIDGVVEMIHAGVADRPCFGYEVVEESSRTNESELVERLRAGDQSAFEALVVHYQSSVYGLLCRLIEDVEEARDLAQETFLKAYQHIDRFRGEANLKTWLYSIAIHQASNYRRWWVRRRRNQTVSIDGHADMETAPLAERLVDDQLDPEQTLMARERAQQITRALAKVKEPYRTALILRDIEEMTYEDIAAAWQVSIGTVKSRIARGREMLRQECVRAKLLPLDG
jgi:RNA polymerase sigma-70 factor (ECF subfamily)